MGKLMGSKVRRAAITEPAAIGSGGAEMAKTKGREPYIGRPLPRFEDLRLVCGRGRFTDDFVFDNQAYAAFVRSPHPHARIVSIDTDAAAKLPGIIAVFTARDYAAAG